MKNKLPWVFLFLSFIYIGCTKNNNSIYGPVQPLPTFSIATAEIIAVQEYASPNTNNASTIYRTIEKNESNFYMVQSPSGYLPLEINFKLTSQNATITKVEWMVGANTNTFTTNSFNLVFNSPTGSIGVRCIVSYKKDISSYEIVTAKDTLTKQINISAMPNWNYTYLGYVTDNPLDTFRVKFDYGTEPLWPGNPAPFHKLSNLPKAYPFSVPLSPMGSAAIMLAGNYPPLFAAYNSRFITCPFGTSFFKSNMDSVEIRFSYGITSQANNWDNDSRVYNKVFIGKRVY